MSIERVNPTGLMSWPPLAHVVISPAGRLAHIAGQAAFDKDFKLLGADMYTQTLAAYKHLLIALAAVGATPADVVSSTVYVVGLDDAKSTAFHEAMNVAVEGKPFPSHAYTMLGVSALGGTGALVEISAVAALL